MLAPPPSSAGRWRGIRVALTSCLLALVVAAPARADDVWAGWGRNLATSVDPNGEYLSSLTLGALPIGGAEVDVATTDRLANGCVAEPPGDVSTVLWCSVRGTWQRVDGIPSPIGRALSNRCVTAGLLGARVLCWHPDDAAAGARDVTASVPFDVVATPLAVVDLRPDGVLLGGCWALLREATCVGDGGTTVTSELRAAIIAFEPIRNDASDPCAQLADGSRACFDRTAGGFWRYVDGPLAPVGYPIALRRTRSERLDCGAFTGVVRCLGPSVGGRMLPVGIPQTVCPTDAWLDGRTDVFRAATVVAHGTCVAREPATLHVHVETADGVPASGADLVWRALGEQPTADATAPTTDEHGDAELPVGTGPGALLVRRLVVRDRLVASAGPNGEPSASPLEFDTVLRGAEPALRITLPTAPVLVPITVHTWTPEGVSVASARVRAATAGPDWWSGSLGATLDDGWTRIAPDGPSPCIAGCTARTGADGTAQVVVEAAPVTAAATATRARIGSSGSTATLTAPAAGDTLDVVLPHLPRLLLTGVPRQVEEGRPFTVQVRLVDAKLPARIRVLPQRPAGSNARMLGCAAPRVLTVPATGATRRRVCLAAPSLLAAVPAEKVGAAVRSGSQAIAVQPLVRRVAVRGGRLAHTFDPFTNTIEVRATRARVGIALVSRRGTARTRTLLLARGQRRARFDMVVERGDYLRVYHVRISR